VEHEKYNGFQFTLGSGVIHRSASHWAVDHEYANFVKCLIEAKTNHDARVKEKGEIAFLLVIKTKYLDIVKCLLDANADRNVQDYSGQTALTLARQEKWIEGVNALLDKGNIPIILDHINNCVFLLAVSYMSDLTELNLLFQKGINVIHEFNASGEHTIAYRCSEE
jgi:ankyrin repeat protein